MTKLILFHSCFREGESFRVHDPVWINPEFVVAVYPFKNGERTASHVQLVGHQTHEDWLLLYEEPDDVRAAVMGMTGKGEAPPPPPPSPFDAMRKS